MLSAAYGWPRATDDTHALARPTSRAQSANVWSDERSFLVTPSPADKSAELRILLTADMGMYAPDMARYIDGARASLRDRPSCSFLICSAC